jgi:poly-gamma-glutamate capsule biosynthesis protein CapA/YwtB (metallophosphatase superfamily)
VVSYTGQRLSQACREGLRCRCGEPALFGTQGSRCVARFPAWRNGTWVDVEIRQYDKAGPRRGGATAWKDTIVRRTPLLCSLAGLAALALLLVPACGRDTVQGKPDRDAYAQQPQAPSKAGLVTLSLGGDVMTGRGIDQILPHPVDPRLHEPYVHDARQYVALAEEAHGSVDWPVDYAYIWGNALPEWARLEPDARVINLETSVTTSDDYQVDKGIHYRMNPDNVPSLTAAEIDCALLANNHVLDWGKAGLAETLDTLRDAGIQAAGAGQNLSQAQAPAVLEVEGQGRVLVYAYGLPTSGIPVDWAASAARPGVNLLLDLSDGAVQQVRHDVQSVERPGDLVVASIHWGPNWGYLVPPEQVAFAHRLIDEAGVDVVYGHSSHHVKGIEVYEGRPILYGCGDLLNDYEGIGGYEQFRPDLALLYFLHVDPATGKLAALQMSPLQVRQLRLNHASAADARWLRDTLDREGQQFGTRVEAGPDGTLALRWD